MIRISVCVFVCLLQITQIEEQVFNHPVLTTDFVFFLFRFFLRYSILTIFISYFNFLGRALTLISRLIFFILLYLICLSCDRLLVLVIKKYGIFVNFSSAPRVSHPIKVWFLLSNQLCSHDFDLKFVFSLWEM